MKWANIYKVIWTINNIDISYKYHTLSIFIKLSVWKKEQPPPPRLPPALLDLLKRTQHPWCYCDDCQAVNEFLLDWMMPAPSIRWDGATTFQFALGRTRIQGVEAGASGHQMLYSCIFGLCRVLCTNSELFDSFCKMNDDYSRLSDIYQAFASQLTMQNQMIQMR